MRALSDRMQALAEAHDIADRPEVAYALPNSVPPTHPALRRPLGFVNPLLYRVHFEESEGTSAIDAQTRAFRDIGVGNTDVTVRTLQKNHDGAYKAFNRRIPGYEASPGWDPVTGLGVPRVRALLARCIEPTLTGISAAEEIDWTGLGFLSSNTYTTVTSDTAPVPGVPAPEDDA